MVLARRVTERGGAAVWSCGVLFSYNTWKTEINMKWI
jgi:hypothetical protein